MHMIKIWFSVFLIFFLTYLYIITCIDFVVKGDKRLLKVRNLFSHT
jgi:hypothetical protein